MAISGESPGTSFDPEEMRMFGLDPASPADLETWRHETGEVPQVDTGQPYDYSADRFEFGPDTTPPRAEPGPYLLSGDI